MIIWCNARLAERAHAALVAGVAAHQLVFADRIINNVEPSSPDRRLPDADIAFGQPDTGQAMASARLKWIQLSSAGYARYDRDDFRAALTARGAMLCNSSSVYAEACAEHALAFLLAQARQLPTAWGNQHGKREWPVTGIRAKSRLLSGQSILLVGFGQIARRLAELLGPLGMKITAVRRKVRGDEMVETREVSQIDGMLGGFDHVMNILPAGAGNDGFFTAARIGLMKRGAVFYNIGRGATVDQTALREALSSGQLAGAYLDVMTPEPLPAGDALWTTPNCFITPHTAGGAEDEFDRVVAQFLENLKRFSAGETLVDRVI